jgi:hypothetical protein
LLLKVTRKRKPEEQSPSDQWDAKIIGQIDCAYRFKGKQLMTNNTKGMVDFQFLSPFGDSKKVVSPSDYLNGTQCFTILNLRN